MSEELKTIIDLLSGTTNQVIGIAILWIILDKVWASTLFFIGLVVIAIKFFRMMQAMLFGTAVARAFNGTTWVSDLPSHTKEAILNKVRN